MQPSFRGPRNSGILQGAAECRDSAGIHPGGNPGANLKSISHRCCLFEVAFVWELTKETIVLPLGCLQGGYALTPDTPEQSKPFTKGGMHDAVRNTEDERAFEVPNCFKFVLQKSIPTQIRQLILYISNSEG